MADVFGPLMYQSMFLHRCVSKAPVWVITQVLSHIECGVCLALKKKCPVHCKIHQMAEEYQYQFHFTYPHFCGTPEIIPATLWSQAQLSHTAVPKAAAAAMVAAVIRELSSDAKGFFGYDHREFLFINMAVFMCMYTKPLEQKKGDDTLNKGREALY